MEDTLYKRIAEKRESVLKLWQAAVLPQDHGFLPKAMAAVRFSVPSDQLLNEEIAALLDWLISNEEPVSARLHLREICKIKAVMAQGPSEALSFILDLKEIVRLVLTEKTEPSEGCDTCIYKELDKRIDQLLLLAFDEYSDWREKIMEIKFDEIQRLVGRNAP